MHSVLFAVLIKWHFFHSVTKNGKLLSQVYEKEKENSKAGLKPRFQKLTKIDIPDLDIHQQYFDNDEIEAARANHVKRNVNYELNLILSTVTCCIQAGGPVGLRMPSAEELAEYILSTGDQASVVDLIEGVVDNGKMSEEQALVYVETIKAMLDTAEKEEDEIRELLQRKAEEAEREEALRNLLRRGQFQFSKTLLISLLSTRSSHLFLQILKVDRSLSTASWGPAGEEKQRNDHVLIIRNLFVNCNIWMWDQ